MPKILNPKLLPGHSPQFVLALQSPLYQAAHAATSRFFNEGNGSDPTTRSRAKSVGLLEVGKGGKSRAPSGPVRGMRGALALRANANGHLRNGVESDWVNVLISVEAPTNAQMHDVPIEVKEVSRFTLPELRREVKQETEEEAQRPVKKRARKREVEAEKPSSGQANKQPRIERQTRSERHEAHISEQLREAVEKAQNYTEANGTNECALRSRNERHVRFLNCITLVLQESSGFLRKSTQSGGFQPSYDELKTFQCNAKRLLEEVEQGMHLFRIKELERIDAEKAKAENDAAAERTQLLCKIESLKEENAFVREECTKLELQVHQLSHEKAEAEKKHLEANADKEKHLQDETKELSKKHEKEVDALAREFLSLQGKSICQMCYINPRDGLVLPCLHLLYCYQCLEKHKLESKECPWVSCRGKINGLLQCNLTGERSPS